MKIIEMLFEDLSLEGVFAISLVGSPAIEEDFIFLSKDNKECKLCHQNIKLKTIDADKHIVTGAILIPDLKIKRLDQNNELYQIFFKKETIEKIAQEYLVNGHQNSVTLEHEQRVNSIFLVESWIVLDSLNDKSSKLGFNFPVGTRVGTMLIKDENIWEGYIKTGILKGFSIEGSFVREILENKTIDDDLELFEELQKIKWGKNSENWIKKYHNNPQTHKEILNSIEDVSLSVYKTLDDENIIIDKIEVGEKVSKQVEGEKVSAPDGTYKFENKISITVVDGVIDKITGNIADMIPTQLIAFYRWTLGSGGESKKNCPIC